MTKTQTIETQIREALAEDFAARARSFYDANPEMIIGIKQGIITVMETATKEEAGKSRSGKEKTLRECMEESANKKILKRYREDVASYDLSRFAQGIANFWMNDKDFYESEFEQRVKKIEGFLKKKKMEVPPEVKSFYESAEKCLTYIQRRDKVVAVLVQKAEEEGIESATSSRAMHAAIKEVFPTADDYSNSGNEVFEIMLKSGNECLNAIVPVKDKDKLSYKHMLEMGSLCLDFYWMAIEADVKVLYPAEGKERK